MLNRTRVTMAAASVAALLTMIAADAADAQSARVRCRVRAARTQISVDGRDLAPGSYTATVDSSTDGAGVVSSRAAVEVVPPADEAEFDFDSNRLNVAAGATRLPRNFVTQPGSIGWQLRRDGAVVLSGTTACVAK
jgi:hypothetical protein